MDNQPPGRSLTAKASFISGIRGQCAPLVWNTVLGLLAASLAACSLPADTPETDAAACDRECIIGLTHAYIGALLSNDSQNAPLAEHFRLVENLQERDLEAGIWQSNFQPPLSLDLHIPDVTNQQAGWMGIVNHDGKQVVLALRLSIDERQIVEAEHLYAELANADASALAAVHQDLRAPLPADSRIARSDLADIATSYYSAVDGNDGSLAPFAAGCRRIENGQLSAGEGLGFTAPATPFRPEVASDCRSQIDSQAFVYIDRIEDRSIVAADPETGLVFGFSRFRHSMENLPYKVTLSDASTMEINRETMPAEPFDLAAAHVFKIVNGGRIKTIEAVGVRASYGAPDPWK